MTVLITGAAGFIGFHVAQALLEQGHEVVGVDNLNSYYDPALKKARNDLLFAHSNFTFYPLNIADPSVLSDAVSPHQKTITTILHLAAQAGVRYSLEAPFQYVESNVTGQLGVLELARTLPNLKHLIYASSSSVYGANVSDFYSITDRVDQPLSLYAATKRAGELMAYSYSHLYGIPTTGLRFFTVYGPWGRPDMAYFIFTKALLENCPITLFGDGGARRDFTYIDDIVAGVLGAINAAPSTTPPSQLFNLGNDRDESMLEVIRILEQATGKKAVIDYTPVAKGDVPRTRADISLSTTLLGYHPKTSISQGLPRFVEWYRNYYRA